MNPVLPDLTIAALPTGPELHAEARRLRDTHHGRRITYSPKVFIPLTMLCRGRCGYCTFAQPPARLEAPYMSPEEIRLNIILSLNFLASLLKKQWQNIKVAYIKSTMGPTQQIYF